MPISKSRNVSSYVRATLRQRKAEAALAKVQPKYLEYVRKVDVARAAVGTARIRLTGSQMAEAQRLLALDPATLACLAKPCRPTSPSPDGAGRA